jgi:N-acetylglucosamine kinase-like BadF-type ATPase
MGWWCQHAMGGFGLVSEALKAAFLAEVGAAPATALGPALADFYGLSDLTELNRWFTRRRDAADPAEKPRAARVVTDAARRGDRVAIDIVREQGRRLAFYAELAARHAGLRDAGAPIPVVLSGSVLMEPDSVVAAALSEQLERLLPGADPRRAVLPPAGGAALDALAEGGVTLSSDVVARLTATLPPPSFFQT